MPPFASLFPPNTVIKDFAYPSSHPLRLGNFEMYGDNDGSDDEYADDFDYHDDTRSPDEINRRAVALFDFIPENDNEVKLVEGQIIWISYRHGQGWLVAEDPATGENGLVPEEYVEVFDHEDDEQDDDDEGTTVASNAVEHDDDPKPFLPGILRQHTDSDSDWVDTEYEDEGEEPIQQQEAPTSDTELLERLLSVKLVRK